MIVIREVETPPSRALMERLEMLRKLLSPAGRPLSLAWLDKVVLSQFAYLFVAAPDHQPDFAVGMAVLSVPVQICRGRVWGEDLVMHPHWRNRGIATALMNAMIIKARAIGASHLDVTVGHARKSSRAMCAKLGFQPRSSDLLRLEIANVD